MENGKLIKPSPVQNTNAQTNTINGDGHITNENIKASYFNNKLPELSPSSSLIMKGVRRRKRETGESETGSYAPTSTTFAFPSQTYSWASSSYYDFYDYWFESWLAWYNSYYDYGGYGLGYDDQWYDGVDENVYIQNQLNSNKDIWDVRAEKFRTYFKNESV